MGNLGITVQYTDLHAENESMKLSLHRQLDGLILDSNYLGRAATDKFEQHFKFRLDQDRAPHVVPTSSGSMALLIALVSAGIRPGDEVITVANSFIATAEAIHHAGAKPIFVDVTESGHIDTNLIADAITERTKAILSVDMHGIPCDFVALRAIAKKHDLIWISDGAQSYGSKCNNRSSLTYADASCVSFSPVKTLGALGDAGAIVTTNKELADAARLLTDHCRGNYTSHVIGYNARMDGFQARVLTEKMHHASSWQETRNKNAERYINQLRGVIRTPAMPSHSSLYNWHIFAVQSPRRDSLQSYLADHGIETKIHYPDPMYKMIPFVHLSDDFPNTERFCNQTLSLPIRHTLKKSEQDYIIDHIRYWSACND